MGVTLGDGLSGHVPLWGNMERVRESWWAPVVWPMAAPRMPHGCLQLPLPPSGTHSALSTPLTQSPSQPPALHLEAVSTCVRSQDGTWGGIWAVSPSRW